MAITIDDFSKIWASTSPLTPYEFSESNYKEGWNFIGGTPPSRQMWDFLQKQNDEKLEYLLNNFDDYAKKTDLDDYAKKTDLDDYAKKTDLNDYLPLAGGTLTGDVFGVTPPNGDNSKKLANTEFIQALASILVPIGCVQAFAGQTTPSGWLLCDGSAVSRTQYSRLFGVIGTTYGAGDGTDTFNLPDLVDKFIQGNATAGTEKQAGLPNITGKAVLHGAKTPSIFSSFSDALYGADGSDTQFRTPSSLAINNGASSRGVLFLDASRSSAIYGNSATVQPPSVTMRYIIKY